MTEENKITVKSKDGQDITIADIQALYDAHEQAKRDLVATRAENKELVGKVDSTSEETIAKWKTRAIKSEAKQLLEGSGVKGADRILKYVNLDGVDFDDKDTLTGFEDKVKVLKEDMPELFDAKKRAAGSSADIHANRAVEEKVDPLRSQLHSALSGSK